MNKLMMVAALATVSASLVGCKSTNVEEWRSDLKTQLCPAKFKPVYTVMKDKGIVKGSAHESYKWWGLIGEAPDTFADEIGGPLVLKPGVREAAFHDACEKSGATILLAPRFTTTKKVGWFWFNGSTHVDVEGVPAKLTGAEEVKHAEGEAPCCVCGAGKAKGGCCK